MRGQAAELRMRGILRPAVFLAVACGARGLGAPEQRRSRAGSCSPRDSVVAQVLRGRADAFVRTGSPSRAALPRGTGAACRTWRQTESCCTEEFFDFADNANDDEARRIRDVRDVYGHLAEDVLRPARERLEEGSSAYAQVDAAAQLLDKAGAGVVGFIDTCEDSIRRFFAVMLCELCDPELWRKQDDGALRVSETHVRPLWEQCSGAAVALAESAKDFGSAATQLRALLGGGSSRAGAGPPAALRSAASWATRAERQARLAAERVRFYDRWEEFREALARSGFRYDHAEWADLDDLHPSQAPEGYFEEALRRDGQSGLQPDGAEEGECVHGQRREGACRCFACWSGPSCEAPAATGPSRDQAFDALFADPTDGQILAVSGCRLPTDEASQLARIRLLQAAGPDASGGCGAPTRRGAAFHDVHLHVPFAATDQRLEYKVRVPLGSEGWYEVCFCEGSSCAEDGPGAPWRRIGATAVFRTRAQRRRAGLRFSGAPAPGPPAGLPEAEAWPLVAGSAAGGRAEPLSLLELGAGHLGDDLVERWAGGGRRRQGAPGGGAVRDTAAVVVVGPLEGAVPKAGRRPLVFTKHEGRVFLLDRCWAASACLNGTLPEDAAASERYTPPAAAMAPLLAPSRVALRALGMALVVLVLLAVRAGVLPGGCGCGRAGGAERSSRRGAKKEAAAPTAQPRRSAGRGCCAGRRRKAQ